MDFKLVLVKRCVRGTFKRDARHSARFEGNICSLSFQNETLKCVTLRCPMAQLVEQVPHIQRLCPRAADPGSIPPVVLCCMSFPLSLPCSLWAKLFRCPHSPLKPSQYNKHSYVCFGNSWGRVMLLLIDISSLIWFTHSYEERWQTWLTKLTSTAAVWK